MPPDPRCSPRFAPAIMNILFTNNSLSRAAGTEIAVLDLCVEMRRRGHRVAACSTLQGEVARRIEGHGIPVTSNPADLPWIPDVIHGHHEWDTTLAALAWPRTPVISFCRGEQAWQEAPALCPNVVRWVAVDLPCRQRLMQTDGIPADKILTICNGVDTGRFRPRGTLPDKPGRALVFSNYASETTFLPAVREGCLRAGIRCDVLGAASGRSTDFPERELPGYDLVFAKGRAALEALASGCAVIVCDFKGLGPMVDPENFPTLRAQSFGFPCMTREITADAVAEALSRWNAEAAAEVSATARRECTVSAMFDRLENLYTECAAIQPDAASPDWCAAITRFLAGKSTAYKAGREIIDYYAAEKELPPEDASDSARILHDRILDAYRKGQLARKPTSDSDLARCKRKSRSSSLLRYLFHRKP